MENLKVNSPDFSQSLNVTVLLGGPSPEREVSIDSGSAIADALERLGHCVARCDISPTDVSALDGDKIDLVFIALHGKFGESGQVQMLCESRGLRYIGAGPRASELAMDKAASKQIFLRGGLATPDWMIIEEFHTPQQVEKWLREIPPPVVLKPVDGGSSIDITIARDEPQRDKALAELLDEYGRGMLERFVPGREFTVSILGELALPVLEIIPEGEFYDYRAKYDDGSETRYVFEPSLDEELCRRMQADAIEAHNLLGCRDISRVDFILDDKNIAQVIEINTIPGFTKHSLLPKAAARAGINFDQLIGRIVELAMQREADVLNKCEG